MMGDLMNKLKQMQNQVEETKLKLDGISLSAEAAQGKIQVSINGNRKIKSIAIDPEFLKNVEAEELEDYLMNCLNKAIEKASELNEKEMKNAASGLLPNFPGF